MGQVQDIHAAQNGPLGSPFQFTTSPTEVDEIDEVDPRSPTLKPEQEAERARYRSWRQGKPDRSVKQLRQVKRSRSGDGGWFGRKIEAMLPTVDPPISSRSRKSSQYMGLFKEQDGRDEKRRHKSLNKDVLVKVQEKAPKPESKSMLTRQLHRGNKVDSPRVYNALALGGPEPREPKELVSSKSHPDLQSIAGISNQRGDVAGDSRHSISPLSLASRYGQRAGSNSSADTVRFGKRVSPRSSDPNSEEDSDGEHISAALFLPHRQVRPDTSPSLEPAVKPPLHRSQSAFDKDEVHVIEQQIFERVGESPEDVEISLESKDQKEVWKSKLTQAEESLPEEPYSPADETGDEYDISSSASELDSQNESAASTSGYESEDVVEKPDGLSPPTPKAPSGNRWRKHRPRVPVGTVQLKPFSHQVGGHSTVYQFSRRAICKQLNNRENVFYEIVEKYHPELLEFMPR
jgi:inositol-hexakisphosphate kinase